MQLVPMSDADFEVYLARLIPEYAASHVRAGNWSADEAEAQAAAQIAQILPKGVHTPDHYLYRLGVDTETATVGLIWWCVLRHGTAPRAFIYDIEIYEPYRRRGYASQALRAVEAQAREQGMHSIGLHVFAANRGARALYEQLGFVETDIQMAKDL